MLFEFKESKPSKVSISNNSFNFQELPEMRESKLGNNRQSDEMQDFKAHSAQKRPGSAQAKQLPPKERPPSAGSVNKKQRLRDIISDEDFEEPPEQPVDKHLMIDKYFFNRSLKYKKKHDLKRKYSPSKNWAKHTYTSGFNHSGNKSSFLAQNLLSMSNKELQALSKMRPKSATEVNLTQGKSGGSPSPDSKDNMHKNFQVECRLDPSDMADQVDGQEDTSESLFDKQCSKLQAANLSIAQEIANIDDEARSKIKHLEEKKLKKLAIVNGLFNDFRKDEGQSLLDMDEHTEQQQIRMMQETKSSFLTEDSQGNNQQGSKTSIAPDKSDLKFQVNQDKQCDQIRKCLSNQKNVLMFSNDVQTSISGWEQIKFLLFFIDSMLGFFKKQMTNKEEEIRRKYESQTQANKDLKKKLEEEEKRNRDANEILNKEIETIRNQKNHMDQTITNQAQEYDTKQGSIQSEKSKLVSNYQRLYLKYFAAKKELAELKNKPKTMEREAMTELPSFRQLGEYNLNNKQSINLLTMRKQDITDHNQGQLDCNKLYSQLDDICEQKRTKDLDLIKRKRDIAEFDEYFFDQFLPQELPEPEDEPDTGSASAEPPARKTINTEQCNFEEFQQQLNQQSLLLKYNEVGETNASQPAVIGKETSKKKEKSKEPANTKEQANIKNEMYTRIFGLNWVYGSITIMRTHKVFKDINQDERRLVHDEHKFHQLLSILNYKNKWLVSSLFSIKYIFVKNSSSMLPQFKQQESICNVFNFDQELQNLVKLHFKPEKSQQEGIFGCFLVTVEEDVKRVPENIFLALQVMRLNCNIDKQAKNFPKELENCDSLKHEELKSMLSSSFADRAEEFLSEINFESIYRVFFGDSNAVPKGNQLKKVFLSGSEFKKKAERVKISIYSVFADLINIIQVRLLLMLEKTELFLDSHNKQVTQIVDMQLKNKELKQGERQLLKSKDVEFDQEANPDLDHVKNEPTNLQQFDIVLSKLEVKNIMRRFVCETMGSLTEEPSAVWDPNYEERVADWQPQLVKSGLGNFTQQGNEQVLLANFCNHYYLETLGKKIFERVHKVLMKKGTKIL